MGYLKYDERLSDFHSNENECHSSHFTVNHKRRDTDESLCTLSICDGRNCKLPGTAWIIASEILVAVVELMSQVSSIISVSSNGNQNGILWAVQDDALPCGSSRC